MSDVPGDDHRVITPDRFWRFWKLLLLRPFEWFFRMRVYGAEHVPLTGPAVIACNHIAGIDVVVLGAASPRTLRYMAKAELFTYNRLLTWAVRHAGAFAVRRGESDLEALRLARRVLRAGHPLGVFCEGTRQPSEAIGTVQPGAALIALAEGAPIVPVVIQGTIFIKKSLRHPVTVMFGPPLAVSQTALGGRQ
jgi:1-acyl-sn-glycerol-3-phosphate acyltransferase